VRSATITFLICVLVAGTAAAQDAAVTGTDLLRHLAGTWKAPEERTPKNSALDEQVFGAGAVDVRTVTLVVSSSGDGTLEIRRSVVGSKGKVFAPSVMDVKLRIGEPVTLELGHLKPAVTVTGAEERYLDGDHERWTREGTRLSLSLVDLSSKDVNIQFDTPDGRGAFGATLRSSSASTGGADSRARRRPS
jgi:hypothetical protein